MTIPDVGPVSELVTVTLLNGTRTSGGSGPGPVQVPPAEAAWLTGSKLAVYGTGPVTGTERVAAALRRRYPQPEQPPAGAAPNYQPRADGSWSPPWHAPEE
jgi:hypothetical protein